MKIIIFFCLLFSLLFLLCSETKKVFFASGKIKQEIFKDKNDGWIKEYYKSGELFLFFPIKNGKFNGVCSVFF